VAKAKSAKSRKTREAESVYRITELVGSSTVSWEDAARRAVETAAGSLRDLRVADIIQLDIKVDAGKVVAYRAKVALSFKYDP
jgi:flavin-binding protein dodecin